MRETAVAKRARARKILDALERAYPGREDRARLLDAARAARGHDPLRAVHGRAREHGHPGALPQVPDRATPLRAGRSDDARGGDPIDRASSAPRRRSLLGMARALVERHGGEVPADRDALIALPGVGLKTANVVLGNAFGEHGARRRHARLPGLAAPGPGAVRGSRRDPRSARRRPARGRLTQAHAPADQSTAGGPASARKPACPVCPVRALCPWPGKTRA